MTDKYTDIQQEQVYRQTQRTSTGVTNKIHHTGTPRFHMNCQLEIPPEMQHFTEVLYHSAKSGKYEANNWLKPDGIGTDDKSNYASIFRHIASAYAGDKIDKDSGLDHRLHAACRLLMSYTRDKRGLNEK